MRESRSSGSVEGVVGNHDPYSDSWSRLGSIKPGASMAPDQLRLRLLPPASLVPVPVIPGPSGVAAAQSNEALSVLSIRIDCLICFMPVKSSPMI